MRSHLPLKDKATLARRTEGWNRINTAKETKDNDKDPGDEQKGGETNEKGLQNEEEVDPTLAAATETGQAKCSTQVTLQTDASPGHSRNG